MTSLTVTRRRELAVAAIATEDLFTRIAGLASAVSECPIALVSLVERGYQRFKGTVGLDIAETPRVAAFCALARRAGGSLVVEDVLADQRFDGDVLVRSSPCIPFYEGVPFRTSSGTAFGSVCVLDRQPRQLSTRQKGALALLARDLEVQLSLRQSLDGAERSSDRKNQTASMIVHDLRSPLQAGLVYAEALATGGSSTAESRATVAHLTGALKTLQRMTTNLLDVSNSVTGALCIVSAPFDLGALALELQQYATAISGTERRVEVTAQLHSPIAYTDRELVRRILENLLSNALKYAPHGSAVRLEISSRPGWSSYRVVDRGPGVPESARKTIFDEHVRMDRDINVHSRTSYGLGLTFCRLAAEALSGRIWVEDGKQGGAVFCVDLPDLPGNAPSQGNGTGSGVRS